MTNAELSLCIGLTPTPTQRRVRALEESGVIAGYRAVINPDAIERGFHALVHVELVTSTTDALAEFEIAVAQIDEITDGYRLFGEPDYLLHVAVRDAEAYEQLYTTRIAALPGIRRAVSQIVMKPIKAPAMLTPEPQS